MASDGKKRDPAGRTGRDEDLFEPTSGPGENERGGVVPDLIRRAMALGFSGFFTTESAIRKALEDTLPQEWVDFAAEQSERTRDELFDRFAAEFGRVMDSVDFVQFAEALLANRTLEINAKIRLGPRDPEGKGGTQLRFRVEDAVEPAHEGGADKRRAGADSRSAAGAPGAPADAADPRSGRGRSQLPTDREEDDD